MSEFKVIPPDVIDIMREVFPIFLADTCTIVEPGTISRDPEGGLGDGTATETPNVECLLEPLNARVATEIMVNNKLTLINPAKISFRVTQAISQQAEIRMASGDVYFVKGFIPRESQAVFKQAICDRVR